MLNLNKVKFCFIQESLLDLNDYEIVIFTEVETENGEYEYSKLKTRDYYGVMGSVMQSSKAIIVWNPALDSRYNERIDMKTTNPFYCFPIIDYTKP